MNVEPGQIWEVVQEGLPIWVQPGTKLIIWRYIGKVLYDDYIEIVMDGESVHVTKQWILDKCIFIK